MINFNELISQSIFKLSPYISKPSVQMLNYKFMYVFFCYNLLAAVVQGAAIVRCLRIPKTSEGIINEK